jgi:apolipoprotein N-acyltransferase
MPETGSGGRRKGAWSRAATAVASGVLMAFSLPLVPPFMAMGEPLLGPWSESLALIGLVPLLWILRDASPRRAFYLGTLAGLAYFMVCLFWLNVAMTTFGHLPLVASLPILGLLSAFLSLFWGVAFFAAVRIGSKLGFPSRLGLPLVWVAVEFLRNYLLTGFPWASLGTTQARSLWLSQLASLGGVYLVAFVVVFSNTTLESLLAWVRRRAPLAARTLAVWALLLGLASIFAFVRLQGEAPAGVRRIRVALVQGNLDERAHLAGGSAQRLVFARMLRQSALAREAGALLAVWPEGSLPAPLSPLSESMANLAPRSMAGQLLPPEMIIGGTTRSHHDGSPRLTISAFLVDSDLRIQARYDKRHLVPFGEYVPLASILPYQWFVPPGIVFFSPGPNHAPLDSKAGKLGIMICYEAIFPEIAREEVESGAQMLVNITNDSWYGRSSAPHQHLAQSRMRAIETGRYLVRAANTGVSAIIDPCGRIVGRLPLGLSQRDGDRIAYRDLEPPRMLTGTVTLLDGKTIYTTIGDLFAWLCSVAALGLLGWSFVRKKS